VPEYRSEKNGLYSAAEDLWLEYRPFFEDLYSITSDFCVSYILYNTI